MTAPSDLTAHCETDALAGLWRDAVRGGPSAIRRYAAALPAGLVNA